MKKTVFEMNKLIKDKYTNCSINQLHIYEIFEKARYIIAYFIKDQYALENISEQGDNEAFAIDESNFVSITNRNLWVVGVVNTNTKKLRLKITFEETEFIKKICLFFHYSW